MIGLKFIREAIGISLQDLADELEVSKQYVSQWELGTRPITEKYLYKLEDKYGFPKNMFVEHIDNANINACRIYKIGVAEYMIKYWSNKLSDWKTP